MFTADYISDIHSNVYLNRTFSIVEELIEHIWADHTDADVLFLNGDIAETSEDIIEFLECVSRMRKYKKIYYVPGNHDLYSEGYRTDRLEDKYAILKELVNKIDNVIFLDGQIVEYEGVKISGLSMWYSTAYLASRYPHMSEVQIKSGFMKLWREYMLDSRRTISDPLEFFESQRVKFSKVYLEAEVFISHINPVPMDSYFCEKFRFQDSNTFFSWNGLPYLENTSIRHYFFGHTHEPLEDQIFDTLLHCNPLAYPGELPFDRKLIQTVSIESSCSKE